MTKKELIKAIKEQKDKVKKDIIIDGEAINYFIEDILKYIEQFDNTLIMYTNEKEIIIKDFFLFSENEYKISINITEEVVLKNGVVLINDKLFTLYEKDF